MSKTIKVLVVDDSALVRQTLTDILASDPDIEVIGAASDPYAAVKRMETQAPDVITLDIEMPRMDGLTFLRKIMTQHPIPVVICSTLTESGSETTLRAMEYGAVDIILKPKLGTRQFLEESRIRVIDAVKAAARAKIKKMAPAGPIKVTPKLSADAVLPGPTGKAMFQTTERVVAVGASTGGTEALREFLEAMPQDCPGIVIVQHMPEQFTAAFAKRLDGICRITVKEASDGDTILRGQALIAPGNRHMLLKRSGARYYVEVKDGPLVRRHRPSVDVLFRSAARYAGKNAVGVIMTGMGDDGAAGMLEMHETGAYTIAQDEASCVVFGMPQEAIKLGGADKIMPLGAIAFEVVRYCSHQEPRSASLLPTPGPDRPFGARPASYRQCRSFERRKEGRCMSMGDEIETKFAVKSFDPVRAALAEAGGTLLSRRFEENVVLDDAAGSLRARDVLLRLRRDAACKVTVKTPVEAPGRPGLKVRREIETEVADPAALEAAFAVLGYLPFLRYEKVRETWQAGACLVCLDELPFGLYLEIEGPAEAIAPLAGQLGLSMEQALTETYHELHQQYRRRRNLPPETSFVFAPDVRRRLLAELASAT